MGRKTSKSQQGEQGGEEVATDAGAQLPAKIGCPALLQGEATRLPKSRRPNMIAETTPMSPQTSNAAAEPVRHLGKLPKFLKTSL